MKAPFRIRGKQAVQLVKVNKTKRKRRPTARAEAVREKVVAPARRCFALFLAAETRLQKGKKYTREQHQAEMKRVSQKWRSMSIAQQTVWKERSKAEFAFCPHNVAFFL